MTDRAVAKVGPAKDLASFFDYIYREASGYVYSPTKRPEDSEWSQHFFEWPQQKEQLLQHIIAATGTMDVYYSPALFSQPSAKKEHFKTTNVLWVEFDGALPLPGTLDGMPKPTVRIRSSHESHEHWYWHLDLPEVDATAVERANRALAYKLKADTSGWDVNQVLRPVATINHKCNKPVTLLAQSETKYGLSIFDSIPEPQRLVKESINSDLLPDVLTVIAKYTWNSDEFEFFKKKEQPEGSRSSALTRLAYLCAEKHLSDEEGFAILIHADERWGKFKNRSDRVKRLLDILNYARQKYPLDQGGVLVEEDGYRVFGFQEFLDTDVHVEWLIPGVLQKAGLLFMSGPPGTGKTTLSLQYGIAMALGREFLGWSLPAPAKIMVLSLEMGHADLKHFAEQLIPEGMTAEELKQLDENLLVIPVGHEVPLNSVAEQVWLQRIIERHQPDGIIIDSLSAASGDAELSNESTVKSILNPLSRMRVKNDMFVWFIHHNRKAQSDNKRPKKLSDVFGSQYIIAQATTVLGVWPVGNDIEINALKVRMAPLFESFIAVRSGLSFIRPTGASNKKLAGKLAAAAAQAEITIDEGDDEEDDHGRYNVAF